jgi:hypothetical protein
MKHRRIEADRGKLKFLNENLSHCHFVLHKFHMDWPEIEYRPARSEVSDWPPEPLHSRIFVNQTRSRKAVQMFMRSWGGPAFIKENRYKLATLESTNHFIASPRHPKAAHDCSAMISHSVR